jgi:4-amino-4-deoxy-L-arabinose transferase-like glycosyltransferase
MLAGLLAGLDPRPPAPGAAAQPEGRTAMLLIALLVLVLALPFANKAFHIDDPLFIWVAQQIQAHPGDPYGFLVNWYKTDAPMSVILKNPPLVSYYMALAASVFGWSEPALHLALLLPALAAALGMYLVARSLCERPLLATLAAVFTPVFLLSSLTLMSDMLMLAFWLFAVHFWMRGLATRSHGALMLAGLLIGLAGLTKYFGVALIPLLGAYCIFKERRFGWPLLYLLLPIALFAWYEWVTRGLYGRGLLLDAMAYAPAARSYADQSRLIPKLYTGLVFTGGCIASALFFARQLWSAKSLALGIVVAGLSMTALAWLPKLSPVPLVGTTHWLLALQMSVWGTLGASLLLLAALDLQRRRDAESILLFLWMTGSFVFAGLVNWSTNGRSVLPMVVPAGILLARALAQRSAPYPAGGLPATLWPLSAAAALSLAVAWADAGLAETARTGARLIQEKHAASANNAWFQGHWGFQYYMQQRGARPVDVRNLRFAPGDIVAVPATNPEAIAMGPQWSALEPIDVPMCGWLATMNRGVGAGFYADQWGPLPFAFGAVPAERFSIFSAPPLRTN